MLNSGMLGAIDALPGILIPGGASIVPIQSLVVTNIYDVASGDTLIQPVLSEQSLFTVPTIDAIFTIPYDDFLFTIDPEQIVFTVPYESRFFAAEEGSIMPDYIGTYNLRKSAFDTVSGVKLTFDYSSTDEIVTGGLVIVSAVCKVIMDGLISTDLSLGAAVVNTSGTQVTIPVTDVSSAIGNVYYITCQPTMNDGSKPLLRSLRITIDDVDDTSIQG